jgi:hypothetical protein
VVVSYLDPFRIEKIGTLDYPLNYGLYPVLPRMQGQNRTKIAQNTVDIVEVVG